MKAKNRSMIDIAYLFMKQQTSEVDFNELWTEVVQQLEFTAEEADQRIGVFYTYLTLDGRFITVGENRWDLRSKLTYERVHIDMNDIYAEVEDNEKELLAGADDDDETPVKAVPNSEEEEEEEEEEKKETKEESE